jgi:PAS domain S-box-containing protein
MSMVRRSLLPSDRWHPGQSDLSGVDDANPANANPLLLKGIAAVVAATVFLVDALAPFNIAVAVLYVVVVLLIAATGSRHATIATSLFCALLTLVGLALSRDAVDPTGPYARCFVSLLALGTATALALRNLTNTSRMREQIQMLNLSHDAIVVYDMNDIITFWNRGAEDVYGFTSEQAVGQSIHLLTGTRFPVPKQLIHDELLRSGRWSGEMQRMRSDGQPITISSRWALWRDSAGRPLAILATNNDITERKHAQAALARSEAFLLEAQRLSKTGSVAMWPAVGEMIWSEEAYRILGYGPEVTPTTDLVIARTHPDDAALITAARERSRTGAQHLDVPHRLLMPDGTVKHVHFVANRTGGTDAEPEYVGALMDVTDVIQTQEALQRSLTELAHVTRVATLGELAASIAHEITQPLAAIVTCGDSAMRWLNRPEPDLAEAVQSVEQMIRDGRRATDIVRQIRAMAQKRAPDHAPLAVNVLVDDVIDLVRREVQASRIELELEPDPGQPEVSGDRVQLQQVLINLVVNAVQATSGITGRRRQIWIRTERLPEQNRVRISVRDVGSGFSAQSADQLFNAFYTTKEHGMGMGLSICRSIVEAHGGRIWAESPPECGATMVVELPLRKDGTS